MEVWDNVKVEIDELPYHGIIINKEDDVYTVSIVGKGNTYKFTADEMTKI